MADETTDLLERLASLPANRREAALRLLGRDTEAGTLRPRVDPSAPVRLSSGQEQVWLTDLMTGEPGSLVDHVAFRLHGPSISPRCTPRSKTSSRGTSRSAAD